MRIRAFLAAYLSVATTRRIAERAAGQRETFAAAGWKVAWVPAANLHLTLKFLGGTPEETLEAVGGRLKRVCAQHPPFELSARGLGAFPSVAQPKVLWVGIEPSEALSRLHKEVEAAMVDLGFAREERVYHPHVTVGRVKHRPEDGDASALWQLDEAFGASQVSEVVVCESRTAPEGSTYLDRIHVPLGVQREESEKRHGGQLPPTDRTERE